MSVDLKPPPRRPLRRTLDALFREARMLERRRRRRRRRRRAAFAIAGCAVAAGLAWAIASGGGGSPTTSPGRPLPAVAVSSVSLPRTGNYFALAAVDGRLIVSGGPQGSLFPSGSTTPMSDGRAAGTCDAATVDPLTLGLLRVTRANCGDPALYGVRVLPVSYLLRRTPSSGGTGTFAIRIAHLDAAAPDGYALGPVVMTYPQCSDCWAQWIYGDGSLWVYDGVAGGGRNPSGELLRVSQTTGAVAQRWTMPQITRPLVAVDGDGFWLAPSNESGWPTGTPASQLIDYRSLYRVSPGARATARVFAIPSGGALWLVAAGHTIWAETSWIGHRASLWRLSGAHATPTLFGRYPAGSAQGAEFGAGAPTYAGNAAIGIYYVANPDNPDNYTVNSRIQQVVRLAPNAPNQRKVATVHAPTSELYASSPPAVALGRSVYFLDPPTLSYPGGTSAPIVQGAAALYRVTPRTRP